MLKTYNLLVFLSELLKELGPLKKETSPLGLIDLGVVLYHFVISGLIQLVLLCTARENEGRQRNDLFFF